MGVDQLSQFQRVSALQVTGCSWIRLVRGSAELGLELNYKITKQSFYQQKYRVDQMRTKGQVCALYFLNFDLFSQGILTF